MKTNGSSTLEQLVPKIKEIIGAISNGKASYLKAKLSSLKKILITADKTLRDKVCYEILSNNLFGLLQTYIDKEPNNSQLTIHCGEMIFLLFSSISNGLCKDIKSKWTEYNSSHNILNHISNLLLKFNSKDNEKEIQLYFKVYLRIIQWEAQAKEQLDYDFHLKLINSLLTKHKDNDCIRAFILEAGYEVIKNNTFKDYYLNQRSNSNEEDKCYHLIKLLLHISTQEAKSAKISIKAIQCLNTLMLISPTLIGIVRHESFIIPFSSLLYKYGNDLIIPIELRSLLLQIINKDDLFILIEVIKADTSNDVYIGELDYKITKEIKDQLTSNTQESFNQFKQSVLSIILLLLKDKGILLILRDINSIESLVHSFKSFTAVDNVIYLSIITKIVLWLAQSYDEDTIEGAELSPSLQRNILCLSMKWIPYINDPLIVQELMSFFIKKSKSNFKEIITDQNDRKMLSESIKIFLPSILNRFYYHHWLFNFIYNLPITVVSCIDTIDYESICSELIIDIKGVSNFSNEIMPDQISKIETTMNLLTLKLSLGIGIGNTGTSIGTGSDERKSFPLPSPSTSKTLYKVFELIIGTNKSVFEKSHSINQIISLMFASIENKNSNSDDKEKCSSILQFINKLTLRKQINDEIMQYLTMKLYHIYIANGNSNSSNNNPVNTLLFNSEAIVTFDIYCLSYPSITPKLSEGIMNILLLTLTFSIKNKAYVTQLFSQNCLLKIIKICTNSINQSAKLNKTFAEILQLIKTKYIEQLFELCSDDIFIQEYIECIKDISFSDKEKSIVNENCYLLLLEIFFILLSNQEFRKETIERTKIVDYLVREATDIFSFYLNTFNPLIVVLIQILSVIFNSIGDMTVMITPKLFSLINVVFSQLIINRESTNGNQRAFDLDNFTNLVQILVRVNIKETECVYFTETYKKIMKIVLMIVFEQNVILKDDGMNLSLSLIEKWLMIEETTFAKPGTELFTIAYFKELILKFPRSNKKNKVKLETLAGMIEREKVRRHESIEEYVDIERYLSAITIKKRVKTIIGPNQGRALANPKKIIESESRGALEESIDELPSQRKRTLINISNNPELQEYYGTIVTSLGALLAVINDKKRKEESMETECELISKHIQILKIFARDRENCQKIYAKKLLNLLIDILNLSIPYSFPKSEVYLLLYKVVEQIDDMNDDFNINELLNNESACAYFIKELMSIKSNYDTEVSDLIYNKTLFITSILSKISLEQSIIQNNTECLNAKQLMIILKNVSNDHFIILNLLSIFNNIISLDHTSSIQYIRANLDEFCKLMLGKLWSDHNADIRIIEVILKAIENIKEEEGIIKEMLSQYDFKAKLNELLIEKSDATLMVVLFNLLNSLMIHKHFADQFLDQTGVNNIINACKVYKSYKAIIEKGLSVINIAIKYPNGGFIESLGKYGVNAFCMFLFEAFMNSTSNDDIIRTIMTIVQCLMRDEYNRKELSIRKNVEMIQSLFVKNIDNESMIIDIATILLKQIAIDNPIKHSKSLNTPSTPASSNVNASAYTNITLQSSNTLSPITLKDKELVIIDTNLEETETLNYDLDVMMIIIEKTLMKYNKNIAIVKEMAKIVRILFKQTNDKINKYRFFQCLVFFISSYLELFLVTSLEVIITEINDIIEDKRMPCLTEGLTAVITSIHQILATDSIHNKTIFSLCIDILIKLAKNNDASLLFDIKSLFPTLYLIKNKRQYHDDVVVLSFSYILFNLFKSNPTEIPIEFLIFILTYINQTSQPESQSSIKGSTCLQILENIKGVTDNFLIEKDTEAKQTVSLLLSLFKANIDNDNSIERIIMIIRKLIMKSNLFKEELNRPEIDFTTLINTFVKSIKGKNKTFLEYQGMSISCMLSSKVIEETVSSQSNSQINTMEMKMSEQEINTEMKLFLTVAHMAKHYSENGDIRNVLLKMDDNLGFIQALDKGMSIDLMSVVNMESCVRSCSTPAFEKSKNIKNLFAKKPKAKKCFTIFGVKTLVGQKTFNVQCETEDDCIKYVDYLSTLINNRKTLGK